MADKPRRIVFGIGPVRELLRGPRPDVSALWMSRTRAEQGDRRGRDAREPGDGRGRDGRAGPGRDARAEGRDGRAVPGGRDARAEGRDGRAGLGGRDARAEGRDGRAVLGGREARTEGRDGRAVPGGRDARGEPGGDPLAELALLAERHGIAVERREPAELDELAGPGAVHQGVVAIAGAYEYAEIEDLLAAASAAGPAGLLVALDGVTDPHNLGAIARSAHLLGAQGLVMPRDRAAAVTAAATKASAGAIEHLAVARVTNLARALEQAKEAGLWTAALDAGPGSLPLWQLDAAVPLCLVLGGEGSGIRPLVARSCDFRVEIPMSGAGVGSFNVSVAAGVALYEIARQRAVRR